ncbi:MAG: hypothetical protein AB7I50_09060 [Vicinamibacterales bacterium]
MKPSLVAATALVAWALLPSVAQTQGQFDNRDSLTVEGGVAFINPGSPVVADAQVNSRPVPRLPDGKVDLTGPWVGGGTVQDIERDGGLKPGELPLLPWARALRDKRRSQDDPYTVCLPMGVLRTNPYPWKFAMSYTSQGLSHIYILHELGDAGNHRVVYMDGRKHPDDPIPSWTGHSIGWWEGDTLVVDTVGFNDVWWFDRRGTPHTEQLHTIERYTRPNWGTLVLNATLEDPGALERPVNLTFRARLLRPDTDTGVGDLLEFICHENNQYGSAGAFRPGSGGGNK